MHSFLKLNKTTKESLIERKDVDVLFVNYNKLLFNPKNNIEKINKFFNISKSDLKDMINVIDKNMYHERREQN